MCSGWTVIIPVKALRLAKSRLGHVEGDFSLPSRGVGARSSLARAFLSDVLDAVALVPRVKRTIVATSDADVAHLASERGALAVDDTPYPGINAAAVHAAQDILDSRIGVLVSDLPWLTPEALDYALALGERHELSFIADADGAGTTLWMATPPLGTPPAFGPSSRAAHTRTGAVDLMAVLGDPPDVAAVRRDVDTLEHLARPYEGNWGMHSAAALESLLSDPIQR